MSYDYFLIEELPTSGGGGDVTVAATGVSATGAAGNVSPAIDVPLTGVSATGTAGNIAGTGQDISGVQGTGSAGTVVPNISVALTGVSATGQVGNVSIAGDVTVAVTGVQATGQVGNVSVDTGQVQQGGHFLPLTEKQLRELKKRERKERKYREDLDQARKLDADSISESIREKFFPAQPIPQAPSVIEAQEGVETEEDEDLEFLLLNA